MFTSFYTTNGSCIPLRQSVCVAAAIRFEVQLPLHGGGTLLLTSAPVTESLVVSPAVTLDVFWPGRTVGSISCFSGRPSSGGHGHLANLASSSGESDARLSTCLAQRHTRRSVVVLTSARGVVGGGGGGGGGGVEETRLIHV